MNAYQNLIRELTQDPDQILLPGIDNNELINLIDERSKGIEKGQIINVNPLNNMDGFATLYAIEKAGGIPRIDLLSISGIDFREAGGVLSDKFLSDEEIAQKIKADDIGAIIYTLGINDLSQNFTVDSYLWSQIIEKSRKQGNFMIKFPEENKLNK